jgi:hypothetical protein
VTDLTAIDVLINPDDAMIARAKSLNARLLTSIPPPAGFALDENHQPHVTTLQRYVRTADLDRVFDAVEEAVNSVDISTLSFTALGTAHMEDPAQPGVGLLVIGATPAPEVLDFQAALIEATKQFTPRTGVPPTRTSGPTPSPTSTRSRSTTSSTTSQRRAERTTGRTSQPASARWTSSRTSRPSHSSR